MRQASLWRGIMPRPLLPSLALWALNVPPTWQPRLDNPERGSLEDIWYVDMPPGWHITTGPAAILWDPATTASGDFRIESETLLFDPEGRREAFGFFFGGSDLEGEGQTIRFFVNGAEVASLPRSELNTAGTVGFRVNHNVNIHLTTLDVTTPNVTSYVP